MTQEMPPIHSRGMGAKKAFTSMAADLEPGERAEAFFHLLGNSTILVTDRRTIVSDGVNRSSTVVLPHLAQLRLERRGFLKHTYLVAGGAAGEETTEARISLSEKDLATLGSLLESVSAPGSSIRSDDGAGTQGSGGLVGALTTWNGDTEEFRKPVLASLAPDEQLILFSKRVLFGAENTSIFVTSTRIGLTNAQHVVAQFALTSVAEAAFSKSLGKMLLTLTLTDGRTYRFGKVNGNEEPIVTSLLASARQAAAAHAVVPVQEFAALPEDLVVTVPGRSLLNSIGDNKREIADRGTGPALTAEVFKTAIRQGVRVHPIDRDVSAEALSGGGVQVTHRPTMTRMAAGAILPGTALIPGLAFQKKKTVDSRTAYFACVHPDWMIEVNVDPDSVGDAIRAAKYVNKRAEALAEPAPAVDPAPAAGDSPATRLREMKALLDDGVITQEDFDRFKASVLGI